LGSIEADSCKIASTAPVFHYITKAQYAAIPSGPFCISKKKHQGAKTKILSVSNGINAFSFDKAMIKAAY
jgi:hypothetical protein